MKKKRLAELLIFECGDESLKDTNKNIFDDFATLKSLFQ